MQTLALRSVPTETPRRRPALTLVRDSRPHAVQHHATRPARDPAPRPGPVCPDLHINCLRALVTVCDLGGFRRAADALYVTQPAISQQIKQLSRFIKAPVFESTRQELRLSPSGRELLGYARRLVALNDEAAAHFAPAPAGAQRITIGVTDQLAGALPAILRELVRALPEAQISALTGTSELLQSEIEAGRLDLALLLNSTSVVRGPGRELGRLQLDWFGQPGVEHEDSVPLVLFTEPCTLRGSVINLLQSSNTQWRIAYEGGELIGIVAALQAGLGVTCLVANGDDVWGVPRAGDLALPEPPAPVPVSLAVRERSSQDVARLAQSSIETALAAYPFAA